MNLPSQKLFLVFIPVIVVIGLFVMFRSAGNHSQVAGNQSNNAPKVVAVENSIVTTVDTDSDGVPDWQEIVWHTDPNNPNTFGISDKDYISGKIAQEQNSVSTSTTISSTDDLSKQLFNRYVSLQSSGELNQDTVDSMTADIASNITLKTAGAPYTAKNVSTFPDSDTAKIQIYASTLTKLYQEYANAYLAKYPNATLEPEDPSFAENSANIAQYYTKFADSLTKIPVPAGAVGFHVAYVNSIRDSGAGLALMGEMKDEPLNALLGLKKYIDAQDAQASAAADINTYLQTNGIVNQAINPF